MIAQAKARDDANGRFDLGTGIAYAKTLRDYPFIQAIVVLIGIGFTIANLPSPVVFGVLAALLSLLPVGGAAFVWIPAALWLFFDRHWGYGIFMVVWGLILGGHFRFGRFRRRFGWHPRLWGHRHYFGARGPVPGAGAH